MASCPDEDELEDELEELELGSGRPDGPGLGDWSEIFKILLLGAVFGDLSFDPFFFFFETDESRDRLRGPSESRLKPKSNSASAREGAGAFFWMRGRLERD